MNNTPQLPKELNKDINRLLGCICTATYVSGRNESTEKDVYIELVINELKQKISQALHTQRQEILEEVEKLDVPKYCVEYPDGNGFCNKCENCISILRDCMEAQDGYNICKDDVLALLKKKGEG